MATTLSEQPADALRAARQQVLEQHDLVGAALRDALCAAVDAVRDQVRNHPVELKAFFLLLFEAIGPLPELKLRFAEVHRLQREGIAAWIRAGIAAGSVRVDVDADAQAALFLSVFRGAMYQWLLDPDHINLDRLFEEQKRNVRRVLQPAT